MATDLAVSTRDESFGGVHLGGGGYLCCKTSRPCVTNDPLLLIEIQLVKNSHMCHVSLSSTNGSPHGQVS